MGKARKEKPKWSFYISCSVKKQLLPTVGTEQLFESVTIEKPSIFKKDANNFQNRVSTKLPEATIESIETFFSVYPTTSPNAPNYSSTGSAFCLIRFDLSDDQYCDYTQALQQGNIRLTIKTYLYPSYPIIQFVIRIYTPGRNDPWWQETIANIIDGDIRDFIMDACGNRKWKLIIAQYNPFLEETNKQMVGLHEKEVVLSEQEANHLYEQAKAATQHYLRISNSQRDFMQAARQFMADNLPIEGIQ